MATAVYLDHHATTPCDPRVVEKMMPFFSEIFGNPSAIASPHGRKAAQAVEDARNRLASLVSVGSDEIIFTSGATESNNLVLASLDPGDHVVSSTLEHRSVLEPLESARRRGIDVTLIAPEENGVIEADRFVSHITPATRLVSLIAASGEIGTIQPIEAVARACEARGIAFHTDATQAVGRIRWELPAGGANLLSASAHKFYGPKGVGFLIARRGFRVRPLNLGGGQERGLRSGTLNVPGIIGLVAALEIRDREQDDEARRLLAIRTETIEALAAAIPSVLVLGDLDRRLPGNLSLRVPGIDAESIIHAMKRFSFSAGAACSARQRTPSVALRSIGLADHECLEVFRLGMGRDTTSEVMQAFVSDLREVVDMLA